MSVRSTDWVAEALSHSGLSQAALAERLSVRLRRPIDRSMVNKMVLGKRDVRADEMLAISEITGLAMPAAGPATRRIPVQAAITSGGRVQQIAETQPKTAVACPEQLIQIDVIALRVAGDAMEPILKDGTIIFADPPHGRVESDAPGNLCICSDNTGADWIRVLRKGSAPGLYHMIGLTQNDESFWDVPAKKAARVRLALPPDLVDEIQG